MYDLVADESVQFRIISTLRGHGFKVYAIIESDASISDIEVLQIAQENQCILLTEDKDFGELTFRLGMHHHGIILLRLSEVEPESRSNLVLQAIEKHLDQMHDCFSVITHEKIRIPRLEE